LLRWLLSRCGSRVEPGGIAGAVWQELEQRNGFENQSLQQKGRAEVMAKRRSQIEVFGEKYGACSEGLEWAKPYRTLRRAWAACKNPNWMLWGLWAMGVVDDRQHRLFAVWCDRRVQHLMTDQRSIAAVEVAERFARGEATQEELAAARDAVWAATRDAQCQKLREMFNPFS